MTTFSTSELKALVAEKLTLVSKDVISSGKVVSHTYLCRNKTVTESAAVFPSCIALDALCNFPNTLKIETAKEILYKFLSSQKSKDFTFNYLERGSKEDKKLNYPDDLDDTFSVAATVYKYKPQEINGAVLAKLTKLLLSTEIKEGGPYKTWICSDNSFNDIDIAVNINIGYFLSLFSIEIPNINTLIEEAIYSNQNSSKYYVSKFSTLYFLSRYYKGKCVSKLNDNLLTELDNSVGKTSVLDLAFILDTLLNINAKPDIYKYICILAEKLNTKLGNEGSFFIVEKSGKDKCYGFSNTLTELLGILAIHKFLETNTYSKPLYVGDRKAILLSNSVELLNDINAYTKKSAENLLTKHLNNNELMKISLIPYDIYTGLKTKPSDLSPKMTLNLSSATLLSWTAYDIYDDIYDDKTSTNLLPLANVFMQRFYRIYTNIPQQKFVAFMYQILNDTEDVFLKESTEPHIQIPDLYKKSLGLALGGLYVIYCLNQTHFSYEFHCLLKYYKHFLTAKQLSDDLFDWEIDFTNGQNTPVTYALKRQVNNHMDIELARKVYLTKVAFHFIKNINLEICKAEKEVNNISHLGNMDCLLNLLEPIEINTFKSQKELDLTKSFLTHFSY